MRRSAIAVAMTAMIALTGCSSTPSVPLAETVQANIDEWFPDGIPTDEPLFALTEIEDMYDGTVRVYIQENLTDAQRERAANDVQSLGYVEGLEVIVIRDASGRDSNHYFR